MRLLFALTALVSCKKDDETGTEPTEPACWTLADGRCVTPTYRDPAVLEPEPDGSYRLSLAATEVTLGGQRHCVRAYNGVYPGPTLDTPASSEPRSVRIDLANRMGDHDFRDLSGEACTCTDGDGATCTPDHLHDACAVDVDCTCRDADGDVCHMADFNTTNLHAHGAHVRPDYARGGEACTSEIIDGIVHACRECGDDVCGNADDDSCFRGDDVLNRLHFGQGSRYRWDIDEDGTHHSGLQWYHPHIHGTTAIQVASGAAGAWIVRGPIDELDGVADATERVMVYTTPVIEGDDAFAPLPDGVACTDDTLTMNDFETLGNTYKTQGNLINGVELPRLLTAPGQVERWRMLNAGFLDEGFLGLFRGTDSECSDFSTADADTIRLKQIGRDGLILPEIFEDDYVFWSTGYRVEALVGGPGFAHGDTWCLVSARFLQDAGTQAGFGGEPMAPSEPPSRDDIFARFDTSGVVIAIVNVTDAVGPATETAFPDSAAVGALAPPLDLGGVDIEARCADAAAVTDPADVDQAAVLQVGFWTVDDPDPCGCENYNVNCKNFEGVDRARYPVDRDLPLGAVEHWRIQSSVDGHPFHIHINPFVVCPNDNPFDPLPFPHWRDTYLVNGERKVDAFLENKSYTGPFVLHCHKLTHEDHGMMELLRVCDPATDPTCGDFHWRACDPDDLGCAQQLAATDCALQAEGTVGAAACVQTLGGPGGACAPDACLIDDHCDAAARCASGSCVPAPCPTPCGPGETCVHGVCE